MQLQIFVKGTKLKLTKDWSFECHAKGYRLSDPFISTNNYTLKKGTILSLQDIDLRGGNVKTPRSVKFLIPKKGCPSCLSYESQIFHVDFNQLGDLEFELAKVENFKLNNLGIPGSLEAVVAQINDELK